MVSRPDGALRAALDTFARVPRVLVAVDFDGVLAPIVAEPSAARALPASMQALTALTRSPGTVVALVSGRALDDLRQVAAPPQGVLLVAGHGAQREGVPLVLDPVAAALLADLRAAVAAVAATHPGTHVETKPSGVVLHTRRAARPVAAGAAAAARDLAATRPGVHVLAGKEVVELSVVRADKGTAVAGLRAATGVDAVLYLGDDATDEHVFAGLGPGDVGIKVGAGDTAARWRVADPAAVAQVLGHLLSARPS